MKQETDHICSESSCYLTPRILMLYVHIPFCPSKCHFCGWVQGTPKRELLLSPASELRKNYIRALIKEIRSRAAGIRRTGYVPNVIYWGGGTATTLTEAEIEIVHAVLADSYDLSAVTEATIEGSPDSVSPEKLSLIRSLGYGRVSFGIQSFNDRRLRQLGRVHSADEARRAVEWAAAADFRNINIDLMCGLPDESLEEVENTVREAVQLPITHISYYPYRPVQDTVMRKQLTSGRGTIGAAHHKTVYKLGRDIIEEAGFAEYAMSYFGATSLNDLAIFRVQQDWLGFGSGAHSLLGGVCRIHQRGHLREYINEPLAWDLSLPAHSPSLASMLIGQGISTFKGIDHKDWLERTGQPLEQTLLQPEVKAYVDWFRQNAGLIEDAEGIRLPREKIADVFIDQLLAMGG